MSDDTNWLRPSPRLWRLRIIEAIIFGLVMGAVAVASLVGTYGTSGVVIGLVVGIVIGAIGVGFSRRRVNAWRYAERDDDLLVIRGVMFHRQSVVPYGRMQFVDVTAGPFERMLGLSTIKLHTAASASDARIPGLERDEALRLRDHLAELGEARAQGL